MGGRKSKSYKAEDDRGIITLDLTREELMVTLNLKLSKKQKNLRIHQMRATRK